MTNPPPLQGKREVSNTWIRRKHNKVNLQQTYIANIDLNGETLKAILLKVGTRQSYPLSSCLFNIVYEVLARTIIQLKGIKKIHIGKEED